MTIPTESVQASTTIVVSRPNAIQRTNRAIHIIVLGFCRWWAAPWSVKAYQKSVEMKWHGDYVPVPTEFLAGERYLMLVPVFGQLELTLFLLNISLRAVKIAATTVYGFVTSAKSKSLLFGPGPID